MPITPEEFDRHFPNASADCRNRTLGLSDRTTAPRGQGADPKPKPCPRKRSHSTVQAPLRRPGKYLVCFESRRRRLTDEDNLCVKYHLDALRYAGAIPDDTPDSVKLSITQTKVASAEEEITIIDIFPPGHWTPMPPTIKGQQPM